ncbi:MAG: folate-binding protein [Burkholderiaceae bacterium]|nr:folate-binding protein [Burkholderiaceae bacterium]
MAFSFTAPTAAYRSKIRAMEQLESGFMATLSRYGLVLASGEDAVTFIHGQLGNDIAGLKTDEARLAGYCMPDGRLLAIMLVWKSEHGVWLMIPRDILPAFMKRLQIYILRAKVRLTDMSDEWAITGFAGAKATDALAQALMALPAPTGIYGKTESASGMLIRISDAFGGARFLWIAPSDVASSALPALSRVLPVAAHEDNWELGDIAAGIPEIYTATQSRFVPQMVNMDLVDGMSFTKGCYPGQEIIARLKYRGTLKRRMIPACADIPGESPASAIGITPGMDIFDASAPDAPCGMLVRAARRDSGHIDCLMVMPLEMRSAKSLRLGTPDGPKLHIGSLPYTIPDES